MRIRSAETRRESSAAIRTIEAALVAIDFGAGAYAIPLFDWPWTVVSPRSAAQTLFERPTR